LNLRLRLAEFGFESNDDYEFHLRCALDAPCAGVRCIHLAGESGRRKTAFAHALVHTMDFAQQRYYDFTQSVAAAAAPVLVKSESEGDYLVQTTDAATLFERAVLEACAFSEAQRTILILDQLQAANFADHIRIFNFVQSKEWSAAGTQVLANARNLLLVLISEQPLYLSLQKLCFRIWTDAGRGMVDFKPADIGLDTSARGWMAAMAQLFTAIDCAPTPSEYQRLSDDLLRRVRTPEQLRAAMFGRMEAIDRSRLNDPIHEALLARVLDELNTYLGVDEISLEADPQIDDVDSSSKSE
jgi:hypothetical protein